MVSSEHDSGFRDADAALEPPAIAAASMPDGPLSEAELVWVLHAAAEVAAGDADHDLISTLYVLNTDVLRPADREQLYELELRQIARALCSVIPEAERVRARGGEIAEVNGWVAQRRGARRHRNEVRSTLTELFVAAAEQSEKALAVEPLICAGGSRMGAHAST